jgi:hypothetical protein
MPPTPIPDDDPDDPMAPAPLTPDQKAELNRNLAARTQYIADLQA